MATLYTHISRNKWKTVFLMTVFFVVVIALGWVASYIFDLPYLLPIAVIVSIVMSFTSYYFSDRIVLTLSGAKYVDPTAGPENKALYRLLENLTITAGLPMPKLYVIADPALNAFATGRDPEHAVICVTTGLIEKLNKQQLEGVLAHELAHIGNRDILISTVAVVLVGIVTLLADWILRSLLFKGDSDNKGGQLGMILLVVGIVFAILSPIFAQLLQLAVSRKREFLADATGAMMTRNPEGLASALEVISSDAVQMKRTNKATAHLYISSPLKKKKKSRSFFSTHPSIEDRVAALRGLLI